MEIAGLKVRDAKKPLTINVTAGDVEKGHTKDPSACAAARSLVRSHECTEARVHLGRTYLKVKDDKGKPYWLRYQTPRTIRSEIIAFDRGAEFAPGEYTLTPLSPTQRLGHTGSETGRNNPRHKKVARIKHHTVSGVRHHGP